MSIKAVVHIAGSLSKVSSSSQRVRNFSSSIDEDDGAMDPPIAEKVRLAFDRIGEEEAAPARGVLAELKGLRHCDVPSGR
jgi:hypothetical protein